jgi:hypothetical protein
MDAMNRTIFRACLCLVLPALAGCAQLTTSPDERASLRSAADAADAAYLTCLDQQAGRYLGTSDDAQSIVAIARKNCAGTRDAAGQAQSALQSTRYIISEPEVEAALQSLDEKGEATITEQVLNRKAAAPAAAGGEAYLACMRDQGERWASSQEPASVIADAAHGRCAGKLDTTPSAAETEKQGRAQVIGIVLDRKAPATRP